MVAITWRRLLSCSVILETSTAGSGSKGRCETAFSSWQMNLKKTKKVTLTLEDFSPKRKKKVVPEWFGTFRTFISRRWNLEESPKFRALAFDPFQLLIESRSPHRNLNGLNYTKSNLTSWSLKIGVHYHCLCIPFPSNPSKLSINGANWINSKPVWLWPFLSHPASVTQNSSKCGPSQFETSLIRSTRFKIHRNRVN